MYYKHWLYGGLVAMNLFSMGGPAAMASDAEATIRVPYQIENYKSSWGTMNIWCSVGVEEAINAMYAGVPGDFSASRVRTQAISINPKTQLRGTAVIRIFRRPEMNAYYCRAVFGASAGISPPEDVDTRRSILKVKGRIN